MCFGSGAWLLGAGLKAGARLDTAARRPAVGLDARPRLAELGVVRVVERDDSVTILRHLNLF